MSSPAPSRRLELGSLAEAAMFECHAGHFRLGREHGRKVVKESALDEGQVPPHPVQAQFALADCTIAQQESRQRNARELVASHRMLEKIDPHVATYLTADILNMPARIRLA